MWLMLHENIYHQWRNRLIDEDTFLSWTRDLEYYAKEQRLDTYWPRLNGYFEAPFADHISAIIVGMTSAAEKA